MRKPYAAGAISGPTMSPQATAMMAGTPQAVIPKSTAEMTIPPVPVQSAKMAYETDWMKRMIIMAHLRPIASAMKPHKRPQTRLDQPRIMNMVPALCCV